MSILRLVRRAVTIGFVAWLSACSGPGREAVAIPEAKPSVYVVNYPLEYFVERLAGDLVEVHFPAPAGEDPAFWKPGRATVRAFQSADLILRNGAGYARWMATASLPLSRVVDTSASFRDRYIEMQNVVTHTHGPEGKHTHGGIASTTWIAPPLARLQANAVVVALRRMLPQAGSVIDANLARLEQDLDELDAKFRAMISRQPDRPLLASHPVYQYLAAAYGLDLRSVHWEPGDEQPPGEWKKLDAMLRARPARWMVWEAPPTAGTAKQLARRGVGVVVFYPCGNRPETGDYLSVMRENAARLARVFR